MKAQLKEPIKMKKPGSHPGTKTKERKAQHREAIRRRPGSAAGEANSELLTRKGEGEGEEGKRVTSNEEPNKKRSQKERTQAHGRRSREREDNGEAARPRKKRSQREKRTPRTNGKRLRLPEKIATQERVEDSDKEERVKKRLWKNNR